MADKNIPKTVKKDRFPTDINKDASKLTKDTTGQVGSVYVFQLSTHKYFQNFLNFGY